MLERLKVKGKTQIPNHVQTLQGKEELRPGRSPEHQDHPPLRVLFPVLLGVVLLGLVSGISVLGITSGINSEAVGVLGSIASAAVGGIAGILSLVFQPRK